MRTAERAKIPDLDSLPWPDREAIDHQLLPRRLEDPSRREQHQPDHRARLSLSLQLVLARGVRLHAPAAQPVERAPTRCSGSSSATTPTRCGTPTTCSRSAIRGWPTTPPSSSGAASIGPSRPSRAPTACRTRGAAALLRELGCYRIWIGSESGSQSILDAMQRGVTVEQVQSRLQARAGARHPGRHVPHVGLRRRGARGHRGHGRARQGHAIPTSSSPPCRIPIKGTGYFDKVRDRVRAAHRLGRTPPIATTSSRAAAAGLLQARRPVAAQRGRGVPRSRPPTRAAAELSRHRAARARASMHVWSPADERSCIQPATVRHHPGGAAQSPTGSSGARARWRPGSGPRWNDFEWGMARSVCVMQGSPAAREPPQLARPGFVGGVSSASSAHIRLRDQRHAREILATLNRRTHARGGHRCIAQGFRAARARITSAAGVRPMGDIDLLVAPRDAGHSHRGLKSSGYRTRVIRRDVTLCSLPPERPLRDTFGEHVHNPLTDRAAHRHRRASAALAGRHHGPHRGRRRCARREPLRLRMALMSHMLLHTAGNMRTNALRFMQLIDIARLAPRLTAPGLARLAATAQNAWWMYPLLALPRAIFPDAIPPMRSPPRTRLPRRLRCVTHRRSDLVEGVLVQPAASRHCRVTSGRARRSNSCDSRAAACCRNAQALAEIADVGRGPALAPPGALVQPVARHAHSSLDFFAPAARADHRRRCSRGQTRQ